MKQIILISGLLFAILSTTNAQNVFSDYVNYLKDSAKTKTNVEFQLNEKPVQHYVDQKTGVQLHLEITPSIQQPDPKVIQRHEWHLFPKPLSVKKFNNKVVVVFDRKQWEAFSYMHRKMWMRRMEMRKQIDELETIRDKYKRK